MIDHTTPLLDAQNGHHAVPTLQAVTRWWTSVDHCVHVIDDDCRFLEAVGYVLKNVELRAEQYPSAPRYLSTRKSHDADCIVLDLRMPDMSGVDLLKTLRSYHVRIPVLMLSAYDDTAEVVTAMQNGATDYLVKPVDEQELLTKISNALRVNWRDKQRLADAFVRLQSLSDREREVMELFAAAKTTRQVANMLGISPKTVEKHRIHIFDKLNVESVPALIRMLFDVQS